MTLRPHRAGRLGAAIAGASLIVPAVLGIAAPAQAAVPIAVPIAVPAEPLEHWTGRAPLPGGGAMPDGPGADVHSGMPHVFSRGTDDAIPRNVLVP